VIKIKNPAINDNININTKSTAKEVTVCANVLEKPSY
jgi:hypothetical protein